MKTLEAAFLAGYKTRAELSNLTCDQASENYARVLFKQLQESVPAETLVMPKIADKTGKRTYGKATIDEIKMTLNKINYSLYNVNLNDTDRVRFAKVAILELDLFGKSS